MPRSWRVIGALGRSPFAPVLAEQRWDGGARLVVLGRPAPAEVAALASCPSPHVVAEEDRVTLDGRALGVTRYASGISLGQLLDASPDGLPERLLTAILAQILAALEAAPVPHGALGPEAVRIGRDGVVRLLGFTGKPAEDTRVLRDLAEEWGALPDAVLDQVAAGRWRALDDAGDRHALGDQVGSLTEAPVYPHPWTDRVLAEATPGPTAPPRARTAAIAAITLVLGFLTGWFYASG